MVASAGAFCQHAAMRSTSIEDYIKTIYMLEGEHQRATTQRIAKRMGVRMASVTGMVKHLAAEGLVKHKPYHGARLTDEGRQIALKMLRRHRLIELFLHEALDVPWDEVHDDAEAMEHAVSDKLIERIFLFLGKPQFDPHGSPIPGDDGSIEPLDAMKLGECDAGTRTRVVLVSDEDADFLRYLTQSGLKIGSEIEIVEKAPFDGPLTLRVGRSRIALGREAACRILVAPV
jgi:DtxR family Mn-dependent transcriptional regulator